MFMSYFSWMWSDTIFGPPWHLYVNSLFNPVVIAAVLFPIYFYKQGKSKFESNSIFSMSYLNFFSAFSFSLFSKLFNSLSDSLFLIYLSIYGFNLAKSSLFLGSLISLRPRPMISWLISELYKATSKNALVFFSWSKNLFII